MAAGIAKTAEATGLTRAQRRAQQQQKKQLPPSAQKATEKAVEIIPTDVAPPIPPKPIINQFSAQPTTPTAEKTDDLGSDVLMTTPPVADNVVETVFSTNSSASPERVIADQSHSSSSSSSTSIAVDSDPIPTAPIPLKLVELSADLRDVKPEAFLTASLNSFTENLKLLQARLNTWSTVTEKMRTTTKALYDTSTFKTNPDIQVTAPKSIKEILETSLSDASMNETTIEEWVKIYAYLQHNRECEAKEFNKIMSIVTHIHTNAARRDLSEADIETVCMQNSFTRDQYDLNVNAHKDALKNLDESLKMLNKTWDQVRTRVHESYLNINELVKLKNGAYAITRLAGRFVTADAALIGPSSL